MPLKVVLPHITTHQHATILHRDAKIIKYVPLYIELTSTTLIHNVTLFVSLLFVALIYFSTIKDNILPIAPLKSMLIGAGPLFWITLLPPLVLFNL